MNVKEAVKRSVEILKESGIESPAQEAGVLFCNVFCCDRIYLYAHAEDEADEKRLRLFFHNINERASGKPLQYITGSQEFMSLDFKVGHGVLIPRHDTETLVEAVIGHVDQNACLRIMDIGTGSGCIAISLAYYLPCSAIVAVDRSKEALEIAKFNAKSVGVDERVQFVHADIFKNPEIEANFDVIVSNPPYIPTEDIYGLKTEVKSHEPFEALDGGDDGLAFYRHISMYSYDRLKDNGMLAFEVGYSQAEEVKQLMKFKYGNLKTFKDISGIDRVVTGIKKPDSL